MATTANSFFQSMLNEYLPNKMLMEELVKRDYVLSNIEIDNSWQGSKIIVPFKGSGASSVEYGQLAGASDISQSRYIRGSIDTYVETWASLIFNHRDLLDSEGKVTENTFLKILPGEVDAMLQYFKETVSVNLLTGAHFATLTSNGTAGGQFEVDHIDRFQIDQKLELDDGNSAPLAVYVIAIDVNDTDLAPTQSTGTVTVSATRGGAAVDVSAYTTAQTARCYHPGVLTNGAFNSIRASLLSAANGGSANIHGVSKLLYPILQAVNIPGAAISATNILDNIFDGYTAVRQRGKGNAKTVLMSFKHMGSVMKILEAQKGPYVVTKQPNASIYGWTEIEVTTVKGSLTLVGILEMDNDVIYYIDWSSMVFRTRGGFKKRSSPDGIEFYETRATSGYAYIVDQSLFGELEVNKPGQNGVIYGINY